MKNWKLLAQALHLDIPEADLDRAGEALNRLEASFRPLVDKIPLHTEPAYIMSLPPEKKP